MSTSTGTRSSLKLRALVAVQVFFLLGSLFTPLASLAADPGASDRTRGRAVRRSDADTGREPDA